MEHLVNVILKKGTRLFYLLWFFYLGACVSVEIKTPPITKSDGYEIKAPTKPFIKHGSNIVDQIWKNPNNGNAISVLTECSKNADPSLQNIENGILNGLKEVQYLSNEMKPLADRMALISHVTGKVDGVPSELKLVTLKKDGCVFIFTFVATPDSFAGDLEQFDTLIGSFETK